MTEASIDLQNNLDREALACYAQAIALDPTRLRGYLELGNAELRHGRSAGPDHGGPGAARSAFAKAIEIAPAAYDGYWFMAVLCEREGRYEEGLEFCKESLRLEPRLEGRFRSKMADFLRMLKRHSEAETEVERAVVADHTGGEPVQAMMALADVYYQAGDREAALGLYHLALDSPRETFEADYDNLIGNLHYYFREYAEAAKAYRKALEKAPKNAVIHSNLAGALEQMSASDRSGRYDEIIKALQQASRLMPENAEYAGKLAKYEHRKRFLLHYGEPSLELIPTVVTPIQPVLEAALLSPILTESRDALRDAILEKIAAMRGHFRDRFGPDNPGRVVHRYRGGLVPTRNIFFNGDGKTQRRGPHPT